MIFDPIGKISKEFASIFFLLLCHTTQTKNKKRYELSGWETGIVVYRPFICFSLSLRSAHFTFTSVKRFFSFFKLLSDQPGAVSISSRCPRSLTWTSLYISALCIFVCIFCEVSIKFNFISQFKDLIEIYFH